jgi:hypothetical protein
VKEALLQGSEAGLDQNELLSLAEAVDSAAAFGGTNAAWDVVGTFESVMSNGNKGDALAAAKDVATGAQNGGIEGAEAAAAKVGA